MYMNESALKIEILCRGVKFSEESLVFAQKQGAKGQNLVYNMPVNAETMRPQELFLTGTDDYVVVASCVAPSEQSPVFIDVRDGKLLAQVGGEWIETVKIDFVPEPTYYTKVLSNGEVAKTYVSSCGYDELNILPWKGCAISKSCLFCGVNTVTMKKESELLSAYEVAHKDQWREKGGAYLSLLKESLEVAITDSCFNEHMHVILISGDLPNEALDLQTQIYCEIAQEIRPYIQGRATEGIVAVLMPPTTFSLMDQLKESGIEKIVYNLEVSNPTLFDKYCPGKSDIGYKHILDALDYAVTVFGAGNVWSNFVLGLEPVEETLLFCESLLKKGIVPSANVLHLDKGNRLDCSPPSPEETKYFFLTLSQLLKKYEMQPYYCSKALRTSLTNEAYAGRLDS